MPTLFFADLVRELCQEGGTGPLTPTGAVPGHRGFAGTVPTDASFHYAVAGIARPEQWEVGTGRIDGEGRLQRDTVAASSNAGERVDFAAGLKTIALTVGSAWFAARAVVEDELAGETAGLAAALAAKQPLSTTHGDTASGSASDLVTLRRGDGWVNLPLSALAFLGGDGRYAFDGGLRLPDGTAGVPAVTFGGDLDTGIFRPDSNVLGFATGGNERMRITSSGAVGIGTTSPQVRLHVVGNARLVEPGQDCNLFIGSSSNYGYNIRATGDHFSILNAGNMVQLRIVYPSGSVVPGADNVQPLGSGSLRWSVVYAGTGTINTSDAREKTWRGGLSPAELAAAKRIIAELGFFQWNDAIGEKGADGARHHFGVRAQAVWAIMADEGLIDPIGDGVTPHCPYAFLCYDEWPEIEAVTEVRDEDDDIVTPGVEGQAGGNRFGVRPDQLALFLIAAQDARIAALEGAA